MKVANEESIHYLKFCIVGGLNTAIDFFVFSFLSYLGIYYIIAQCVSYGCGVLNSYFLNRTWTFQQQGTRKRHEFLKFTVLNIFTLIVTSFLLTVFHYKFNISLPYSKVLVTIVSVGLNYIGTNFWVFKP
ncbi:GtrA family protein [Priestia megaterium]|uniref:GtrA family protein n=1 Tax=Priestia megaterium TaxID=1404 RepID=UPI00211B8765|nr:GtrA family protein [Priestia megaterium]MDH3161473.1 GtrA family protein [Priestia megaterium]MED4117155.1 GtrA family protein [Priestia megaterium]